MRHVHGLLRCSVVVCVAFAVFGAGTAGSAAPAPDGLLWSDDFESGLDGWDPVTQGAGTVTLEPGQGSSDSTAVRMVVPETAGSMAYLKHRLSAPSYSLSVSGRFKVVSGGCDENAGYSKGSVPLLRFFDTEGRRVVGVYRINGNCGTNTKVYVQHSRNFWRANTNMRLGSWYTVELRATVDQRFGSLVELYIGGRLQFSTTTADNGSLPFASVNLHNEHPDQVGDLVADDIRMSTFGEVTGPENPCAQDAPPPASELTGTMVLADGFESNDFGNWSVTQRDGDGQLLVQTAVVHSDACAALVRVTASAGSRAYLRKDLPAGTRTVWADGWFHVAKEGAAGSNVPLLRFFDGSTRLVDLYRQNDNGRMWLRTVDASGAVAYTSLGRVLGTGSWHRAVVGVTANGAGSAVEVRLDGATVFSGPISLFGSRVQSVQVGAEHFAQVMDLLVDGIVITASS